MTKNKKNEGINIKNYFILFIIFFVSMVIVLYLCNVYKVYEMSKLEEPVIRGSLIEINTADLSHYVIDTPSVIVYMCAASDDECRKFEKKLKKFVQREEIVDEIIYLNLSNTDLGEFTDNFNKDFKFKTKLKNRFPAFISFSNGEVDAILQGGKDSKLTISKVENFWELYKLENIEDASNEEE